MLRKMVLVIAAIVAMSGAVALSSSEASAATLAPDWAATARIESDRRCAGRSNRYFVSACCAADGAATSKPPMATMTANGLVAVALMAFLPLGAPVVRRVREGIDAGARAYPPK